MTRKIRNIFLTILSGFLAFACLLATLTYNTSAKVYADETDHVQESRKTADDNFSFRKSSVKYNKEVFDVNAGVLVFSLSLDNAVIDGYNGNGLSTGYSQNLTDQLTGTKCPNTEARLSFTVYKGSEENNDNVAIAQYDIVSFMNYTLIYKRKLSNKSNLTIGFNFKHSSTFTSKDGDKEVEYELRKVALYDEMRQARSPFKTAIGDRVNVFYGEKFGIPFTGESDGAFLNIGVFNVSVQDSYYIDLTYCFFTGCGSGFNYGKRDKEYIGNIKSENASIVSILTKEKEDGTLAGKSDGYRDYADKVISGFSMKTIKVRFLENLKTTPFAVMTEETVTIPTYRDTVVLEDVLNSLSRDTLVLKYSSVERFVKDETLSNATGSDVYVAKYRESIRLSAKTTDTDRNKYYYFNLNNSYRDYFEQFVNDGIIDGNLYSWFYNDILTRQYPSIKEIEKLEGQEADLYGYFGFIMIPQTNSIEAVWGDLFNKETTYSGTIHFAASNTTLSLASYNKLLSDYNYSWFEKAWNSVTGIVTNYDAKLYMFYVDSAENGDLWIGENGAADKDDNKGSLVGDISDGATQIGDIVSNLWNNTIGALSKLSGGIAGTIIIIAVVVGIIFLIKYKKGGKRRR